MEVQAGHQTINGNKIAFDGYTLTVPKSWNVSGTVIKDYMLETYMGVSVSSLDDKSPSEYLKELCDLIKIRMEEKNQKTVRLSPFLAIEEVISKFDDEKQKEFFNDLKVKDPELYYKYLEWKVTSG